MIRIGKQLPDGSVRYIKLNFWKGYDVTSSTLKNFYPTEARVDALLELGDLNRLGSSPKGKWKGENDNVHCCSFGRDCGEKIKFCQSRLAIDCDNFSNHEELAYLFDRGTWYVFRNGRKEIPYPFCVSGLFNEKPSMEKLKIYENKSSDYSILHSRKFDTWKEARETAIKEHTRFFVFLNNKLIHIIKPLN